MQRQRSSTQLSQRNKNYPTVEFVIYCCEPQQEPTTEPICFPFAEKSNQFCLSEDIKKTCASTRTGVGTRLPLTAHMMRYRRSILGCVSLAADEPVPSSVCWSPPAGGGVGTAGMVARVSCVCVLMVCAHAFRTCTYALHIYMHSCASRILTQRSTRSRGLIFSQVVPPSCSASVPLRSRCVYVVFL